MKYIGNSRLSQAHSQTHTTHIITAINQSINQSFICSEQHKKKIVYTIQCRTGHKGV